jgi:hypothetical protein
MRILFLLGLAVPVALQAQIQRPSRIVREQAPTPVFTVAPDGPAPVPAPMPASDPSGFTATARGNTVVLAWQAVPGVSWYLLGGPGMGLNGQQVQGTGYIIRDLGPGHYEWTVASLAGENQYALNNGAKWPKANLVLGARTVGSYRVSIAGFRVDRTTYDDQLNRDGASDEVYASVIFQRFDRSGALVQSGAVTSRTHGDASRWPTRVPQGSATGHGGLAPRDVVPFGWDERDGQQPVPGDPRRFPLNVWQGVLADSGDVLVLRPSLWEEDGDPTAFHWYARFLSGANPGETWGLPGIQQSLATTTDLRPINGISPERRGYLFWTSNDFVEQAIVANKKDYYVDPGRDRPIGMSDGYFVDQAFVLTRERIETELSRTSAIASPPGILTLRLRDRMGGTQPLNGEYVLYLRVERM